MKQSGFTLIELLIVIAIIAILAAILFPAFASAREKARQTTCASNMKQLTLAMIQYSEDFDEVYPSLSDYVAPTIGWATQVYPYVKSYKVYECPDDQVTRIASNPPVNPVSYGMPDNLRGGSYYTGCPSSNCGMYSGMGGWRRNDGVDMAYSVSMVYVPDRTIMLVEYYAYANYVGTGYTGDQALGASMNFPCTAAQTAGGAPNNYQDSYTKEIPGHNGGWNYGFVDGHVKWLQPQQTLGKGASCVNGTYPNNAGMWTVNQND